MLLVALLITGTSYEVYILTYYCLISAHKFVYVAYMWHLRGIFVHGTYLAIIYGTAGADFWTCMYSNEGLYVDHSSSAVEHVCFVIGMFVKWHVPIM